MIRFEWPVDGWFRGFSIEIVDAAGKPIDRRLVHHLIAINFDRRQLLYPSYERIFGSRAGNRGRVTSPSPSAYR